MYVYKCLVKRDSFRAPHLDKTDFQIQRNPRNRPSFHHKKYRLMLDPLIIITSENVLKCKNKKYKQERCELEF